MNISMQLLIAYIKNVHKNYFNMKKIINKIKERLEQLNIKQIIKVFLVFLLDTLINVFEIIIIVPLLVCYILTDILLKISLYFTKIKDFLIN